jgi:hypothetical protein
MRRGLSVRCAPLAVARAGGRAVQQQTFASVAQIIPCRFRWCTGQGLRLEANWRKKGTVTIALHDETVQVCATATLNEVRRTNMPFHACRSVLICLAVVGCKQHGRAEEDSKANRKMSQSNFSAPAHRGGDLDDSAPHDAIRKSEGNVKMLAFDVPATGGQKTDIDSPDPACGTTVKNSRCVYECLDSDNGMKFVQSSITFAAKNDPTCAAWNEKDARRPDWSLCTDGIDCPISYSKWEITDLVANDTKICGRFKNWDHARRRCAKIQAMQTPL